MINNSVRDYRKLNLLQDEVIIYRVLLANPEFQRLIETSRYFKEKMLDAKSIKQEIEKLEREQ